MRIFLRKSLLNKSNSDYLQEIFLVTEAGMRYYNDLFGTPYPFSKYD